MARLDLEPHAIAEFAEQGQQGLPFGRAFIGIRLVQMPGADAAGEAAREGKAKAAAAAEGERQLAQARAQIEQEMAGARDALRAQVAALAVAGAEKILEAQVDANAHAGMLDKLAAEL